MSNWNWKSTRRDFLSSCLFATLAPNLSFGQSASDFFALGAPLPSLSDGYNLADEFNRAYDEYSGAAPEKDGPTFNLLRRFLAGSSFSVRACAKTSTPGRAPGVFVAGDYSAIEALSERAGYLYVFYQFAEIGTVRFLYPYDAGALNNRIEKQSAKVVPAPGEDFHILVAPPFGREYVVALVTTKKLPPSAFKTLRLEESNGDISPEAFGAFLADMEQRARSGDFEYGVGRARVDTFDTAKQAAEFVSSNRVFYIGIGIDRYADSSIPRLSGCVNNTVILSQTLKKYGLVDPKRVLLIKNEEATQERVNFLFDSVLPDETRPGDCIIAHWSGHGATSSRTSMRATLGKGEGFFPADEGLEVRFVTHESVSLDGSTMLSADRMNGWVDRLAERQVLFVLDCCYSGGMIDASYPWRDVVRARSLGRHNIGVIAACEPEQTARIDFDDHSERNAGIMTVALVQLLNERVDASDEPETVVNVKELAEELVERVPEMRKKRDSATQDPYCVFSYDEDLKITLKKPKS